MSDQEMFTKIKNSLRQVDRMIPQILDKTNPRYM